LSVPARVASVFPQRRQGLQVDQGACRCPLDVEAGEIVALMGSNGAGKSTLVKILSCVIEADAGDIVFRGQPFRPRDGLLALYPKRASRAAP